MLVSAIAGRLSPARVLSPRAPFSLARARFHSRSLAVSELGARCWPLLWPISSGCVCVCVCFFRRLSQEPRLCGPRAPVASVPHKLTRNSSQHKMTIQARQNDLSDSSLRPGAERAQAIAPSQTANLQSTDSPTSAAIVLSRRHFSLFGLRLMDVEHEARGSHKGRLVRDF